MCIYKRNIPSSAAAATGEIRFNDYYFYVFCLWLRFENALFSLVCVFFFQFSIIFSFDEFMTHDTYIHSKLIQQTITITNEKWNIKKNTRAR